MSKTLPIERRFASKKKRRTELETSVCRTHSHRPAAEVMREGPAETTSVRAKSGGHGKKTVDKWNR